MRLKALCLRSALLVASENRLRADGLRVHSETKDFTTDFLLHAVQPVVSNSTMNASALSTVHAIKQRTNQLQLLNEKCRDDGRTYGSTIGNRTNDLVADWGVCSATRLGQSQCAEGGGKKKHAADSLAHALALRTATLIDQLSPNELVSCIVGAFLCDVLSDDLISRAAVRLIRHNKAKRTMRKNVKAEETIPQPSPRLPSNAATSRQAKRIESVIDSILAPVHTSSTISTVVDESGLTEQNAIALCVVLSKALYPGHHQLHELFHEQILPVLKVRVESMQNPALLTAVLAAMAHYSTVGPVVELVTRQIAAHKEEFNVAQLNSILRSLRTVKRDVPVEKLRGVTVKEKWAERTRLQGCEDSYTPLVRLVVAQSIEKLSSSTSLEIADLLSTHCELAGYPEWALAHVSMCDALLPSLDQLSPKQCSSLLRNILHRNTYIPDHPLHRALLVRCANAAVQAPPNDSVRLANTALLSWELLGKPAETEGLAATLGLLFERHHTALDNYAFVSGLQFAQWENNNKEVSTALLTHFNNIASSLNGKWLARGMQSVLLSDANLQRVDDITASRWISKLGSDDYVKSFPVEVSVQFLKLLAKLESLRTFEGDSMVTNSLAKQTLVTHAFRKIFTIPVSNIADSVQALRHAKSLHANFFSRFCRSLLASVDTADLDSTLQALFALADVYTSRRFEGTVFRDVWQMARRRVIDTAHQMNRTTIRLAFNAFSALDIRDAPIFESLLLRFWELETAQGGASAKGLPPNANAVTAVHTLSEEGKQFVCTDLTPISQVVLHCVLSNHDTLLPADGVRQLVPLVSISLLQQYSPARLQHAQGSLFTLQELQDAAQEVLYDHSVMYHALYPVHVVSLLASSIRFLSRSSSLFVNALDLRLLHQTVEESRSLLLMMFPHTATDVNTSNAPPPIVRRSTQIPAQYPLDLINSMGEAGIVDIEMLLCAWRMFKTPKVLGSFPVPTMLRCCFTMLEHLTSPSTKEEGEEESTARPPPTQQSKEVLASVLSLLWNRVEEMDERDIVAVRRCVEACFGAGKMDADFSLRLDQQLTLIQARKEKASTIAEKAIHTEPLKPTSDVVVSPEDLFDDLTS